MASNHYTALVHQDVLVLDLKGHLGTLLVPHRVLSDLGQLLAGGGCDAEKLEEGWSAASFFMMSAVFERMTPVPDVVFDQEEV